MVGRILPRNARLTMAGHISLSLSVSAPAQVSSCVDVLRRNPASTPVALGGLTWDGYFVAGYALESLASQWLNNVKPPISVDIASTDDARDRDYLSSIAKRLIDKIDARDSMSPYETADDVAGLTWVDCPRLGDAAVSSADAWLSARATATMRIECSVALSVARRSAAWTQAFRELYPREQRSVSSIASMLLQISIRKRSDRADAMEISLWSSAHAWLREGAWVNDHRLRAEHADANLETLASIGSALAATWYTELESVALKADGATFLRESERIPPPFNAQSHTSRSRKISRGDRRLQSEPDTRVRELAAASLRLRAKS